MSTDCSICEGKKVELTYETQAGTLGLVRRLLVCLLCDFNGHLPAPRRQ